MCCFRASALKTPVGELEPVGDGDGAEHATAPGGVNRRRTPARTRTRWPPTGPSRTGTRSTHRWPHGCRPGRPPPTRPARPPPENGCTAPAAGWSPCPWRASERVCGWSTPSGQDPTVRQRRPRPSALSVSPRPGPRPPTPDNPRPSTHNRPPVDRFHRGRFRLHAQRPVWHRPGPRCPPPGTWRPPLPVLTARMRLTARYRRCRKRGDVSPGVRMNPISPG